MFFNNLSSNKNIIHAISTRQFGSMKGHGGLRYDNIKKFLSSLEVSSSNLIFPKQIHSGKVHHVENVSQKIIPDADGLITQNRNIFLGIVTADCLPILFYDKNKHIIAAVHAGYKGLSEHIIENTIQQFKFWGSITQDILVAIGPCICVKCYEVQEDRVDLFKKIIPGIKDFYVKIEKKYFLDLIKITLYILIKEGIDEKNIEAAKICTKENIDVFYSYRGEGKETYGEFISFIGMI